MPFGSRFLARIFFKSLFGIVLSTLSPFRAVAQVQTEMRFYSDSFISSDFEATEKNNYQFVGAQLKTDSLSQDVVQMNITGGVAVGAPLLNYLNISEFYFQSSQTDDEYFYFGRKRMHWNELDSRWDLGVWEPLFKWNPLSPEHQGLSGIFWQANKPMYSLMLFASPFYIPDQGPSFEIQDGTFVRGNPWFRRPPESIRLWSEATAIDYRFNMPDEVQIVMQKSFGTKVAFGNPNGLNAQLSYIYKPSNQLAIGYDGNLDVGKLKGAVELKPQVFYHSLTGADVSYRIGETHFGLSAIWDNPDNNDHFDEKWTHPLFNDAMMWTPFFQWSGRFWSVSFQHLDVIGGEVTESGDLADPRRAALMVRYPFQQAEKLTLTSHHYFRKNRQVQSKLSLTHSQKNDFDLLQASARVHLSPAWSVLGEMQLVRAGIPKPDNQNTISQFVNNDRMMLGAVYVF